MVYPASPSLILSDQNFPPILPASDGRLFEINNAF
jgi:hypothetical protein